MQRTRRSTFSRRSAAVGSSRMKWKWPSVSSSRRGRGAVEAQQPLRGEDDQRPRLADQRLAAQQVEVLGGGARVGDADVALGGQRQEALDAGAGVLRPGALVAVREQQGEAAGLSPLGLAGDDEAVDDHLAGVGEVAELRLPEDQRVRGRRRVAVLEAEAGDLRERAVVELEGGVGVGEVLHRAVLEAGLLVVEDEVAVGEGAALGVLAGEADVDALGQQRGEGERLGVAELDPAVLQRLDPLGERFAQLAVDREALRHLDQRLVQLAAASRSGPRSRPAGWRCGRVRRCSRWSRSGLRTRPAPSSCAGP